MNVPEMGVPEMNCFEWFVGTRRAAYAKWMCRKRMRPMDVRK